MKKALNIFLVSTLFLVGCESESSKGVMTFDYKIDVPEFAASDSYQTISTKESLLSRPLSMFVIDSLIVVYDPINNDKVIVGFDKQTHNYLGRHINKGRGPGEVINVSVMPTYDQASNAIVFVDDDNGKIIEYDMVQTIADNFNKFKEIPIRGNSSLIYAFKHNDRCIITSTVKESRFTSLEGDSLVVAYDKYPKIVVDEDENACLWHGQSKCAVNDDMTKMVVATYIGAALEFLDISDLNNIKSTALLPIAEPIYGLAQSLFKNI